MFVQNVYIFYASSPLFTNFVFKFVAINASNTVSELSVIKLVVVNTISYIFQKENFKPLLKISNFYPAIDKLNICVILLRYMTAGYILTT